MPTLNWIGKDAVVNHHQQVPYHLLKDVPDLSCGEPGDGNLIVHADNLIALKALLPYYAGQVKCIYIDPPYNTGNEGWAYNDSVNSSIIREWLGQTVGGEGETLDRHDRWLCMMYPRLALLRQFLCEDGAIFISIDDNEIQSLRYVMDSIFGKANFVECITWNKRIPKNDAGIGNIHEYIVIYRKSTSWDFEFTMPKEGLERVVEFLEQLKQSHCPIPEAETKLRKLYKEERYDRGITLYNSLDAQYRPWGKINLSWPNANTFGPRYTIFHPLTKKAVKIPDRGWRWTEETFQRNLDNGETKLLHDGSITVGRIWFDKDEKTQPSSIKYLEEVNRILLRSIISMKSDGGIELEQIFGQKAKFAYPKPTSLIQLLIDSIIMEPGDIVLDSFAGSGTTAHAVLRQNAEDGISRKFILLEMEANVAREVTTERVRRVVKGYTNNKGERVEGLGGGFRFCELGELLFDEAGRIRKSVRFAELARHVYFSETGEPLPRERVTKSPFLGECRGVGIYLLFNGILGDKSANGGNVLTRAVFDKLPPYNGQKVIYCEGSVLGRDLLRSKRILVRQIPYEIKVA